MALESTIGPSIDSTYHSATGVAGRAPRALVSDPVSCCIRAYIAKTGLNTALIRALSPWLEAEKFINLFHYPIEE